MSEPKIGDRAICVHCDMRIRFDRTNEGTVWWHVAYGTSGCPSNTVAEPGGVERYPDRTKEIA